MEEGKAGGKSFRWSLILTYRVYFNHFLLRLWVALVGPWGWVFCLGRNVWKDFDPRHLMRKVNFWWGNGHFLFNIFFTSLIINQFTTFSVTAIRLGCLGFFIGNFQSISSWNLSRRLLWENFLCMFRRKEISDTTFQLFLFWYIFRMQ